MSRFSKRIISFAAAALLAVQCLSASAAGVSAQSAAYESSIELLKTPFTEPVSVKRTELFYGTTESGI